MGSRALPHGPDGRPGESPSGYIIFHLAHRQDRSPGCLRQITAIGDAERLADRIDRTGTVNAAA
jgi:hypothetical protein